MNFIPLHIRSVYSFFNSCLTIENIVLTAKKNNLSYISLTDFNSLSAAIKFCSLSQQQNITPIIGVDLKINDLLITFLIKNENGYKNILILLEKFNNQTLFVENLIDYNDGLIAIVSSKQSKLLEKIQQEKNNETESLLKKINDIFKNNFFIGLEIYNGSNLLNIEKIRAFIKSNNFQNAAFPLIKYQKPSDELAYLMLQSIQNNQEIDKNQLKQNGIYYFYDETEIQKNFTKEEISNTQKIAHLINFDLIKTLKNKSANKILNDKKKEEFKKIVFASLEKKIGPLNKDYYNRLNYEIDIINRTNYTNYFLVVADYVQFAKNKNIYIGPGRGSAGGSLVAYALGIITIDPIKHGLLFERFLNVNRGKMPDIDIDVESEKRSEIIQYLRDKYGVNNIGFISVIQTIKAKQSLNYIEKLFNIKNHYIATIHKALNNYDNLKKAYKESFNFKKLINSDKYYLFIFKMASKIENFPCKLTTHASGIIISNNDLTKIVPTFKNENNNLTISFTSDDLEKVGFTKMDLLSLDSLSIIKKIIKNINKNKKDNLNFDALPYDDKTAIEFIANGYTAGIFQLESKNEIIEIMKKNISNFDDIVLLISLYRPGSIKHINEFLIRQSGKKQINYPSNKIINILRPTYGIIVFQEQIIQIVNAMANYDFNKADIFRRQLTKKINLNILKENFINDSVKNGCSITESRLTFDLLENFASFNFNKSHAVAYAKLICQMAFLKAHYDLFFYVTILNRSNKDNVIFNEIQKRDILLSVPNINDISDEFVVKNNSILFSIAAICSAKQNALNILKERDENGFFSDFIAFATRMTKYRLPQKEIESLINCGCFDCFNQNRHKLRMSLKHILNFANLTKNITEDSAINDVIPKPKIINVEKNTINYKNEIINECNCLNFLVTPILKEEYKKIIGQIQNIPIKNVKKNSNFFNIVGFIKQNNNTKNSNYLIINDIYGDSLEINNYVSINFDEYLNKMLLISCHFDFQKKCFTTGKIKIL
ncbi:MAG: DNA polymerase III subunit alpha [Bacilli bacterium]|nr:DNA polymerase III subunit alpha [Bacilli bacterium]